MLTRSAPQLTQVARASATQRIYIVISSHVQLLGKDVLIIIIKSIFQFRLNKAPSSFQRLGVSEVCKEFETGFEKVWEEFGKDW